MLRQREGRRFVSVDRVAALAGIEVWRGRKLFGMLVLMAVGAMIEFQFENGVTAFRDVALLTPNLHVPSRQRVCRLGVVSNGECRRFPSLHRMTGRAFAAIRPFGELPFVRIGLVTIRAFLKRDRLFEISAAVAQNAPHGCMFPEQREWSLGVVEFPADCLDGNVLPT